jgi:LPXTG-motif cell wall-anchored protein
MRLHDLSPAAGDFLPAAHTPWEADYGTRGFLERERPYFDERPPHRPGWESGSRWGGRPVREKESNPERRQTTARRFIVSSWTRIRNAVRGNESTQPTGMPPVRIQEGDVMRNRIFALGLMIALSIGGAAWAQQLTDEKPVMGRVTAVDASAKTFTLETANGPIVFKTDVQTMFMRRDATVNLPDLKVGDQVEVTYAGAAANRMAAHVHTVDAAVAYAPRSPAPLSMPVPERPVGTTVTGRVMSVDVPARTVTLETNAGSRTYALGTDAQIVTRTGSTDLDMISTGDRVRLTVGSDARSVSRIEFVPGDMGTTGTVAAARDTLPRTASSLPLLALAGLAMIGGAFLIRARRLRAA